MRRDVQKNKNKQKQEFKAKKIESHKSLYSTDGAYMNITTINLSKIPTDITLKLPYNFIIRDATLLSNHEITYLCRASDLLILSVTSSDIDEDLISLIKKSMPTVVIVYEKKLRSLANPISRSFGNPKICEFSMLNMILEKLQCENTHIATTRPFMVAREVSVNQDIVTVSGFMKNSLRSNKVIINGIHEGIIEEVCVDGTIIPGESLIPEENDALLSPIESENTTEQESNEETDQYDENEEEEVEEIDFDEQPIEAEIDLINKYSEYRGIRNLATCSFKDQKKPDHYKDIIFIKNMKYAQSQIKNRETLIPKNKSVVLKIRTFEPIQESIFVMFNLFEYETRKTIHSFDFSSSEPLPKKIIVDNGYRIFTTDCIVSRNLNNRVFKEEKDLLTGVVSFIGPVNLYGTVAFILTDVINSTNTVRLLNGRTEDRIFFECVELKGKPIKICKSYVVVKGMFFNKEQVEYFRNIKVESRNGVSGFIKRPLGTKGLFKAYFSQQVKHGENITMNLYKRIFL